jgi:hypothetical protein
VDNSGRSLALQGSPGGPARGFGRQQGVNPA